MCQRCTGAMIDAIVGISANCFKFYHSEVDSVAANKCILT